MIIRNITPSDSTHVFLDYLFTNTFFERTQVMQHTKKVRLHYIIVKNILNPAQSKCSFHVIQWKTSDLVWVSSKTWRSTLQTEIELKGPKSSPKREFFINLDSVCGFPKACAWRCYENRLPFLLIWSSLKSIPPLWVLQYFSIIYIIILLQYPYRKSIFHNSVLNFYPFFLSAYMFLSISLLAHFIIYLSSSITHQQKFTHFCNHIIIICT